MPSHIRGEEQACIGLVDRVAFRTRKIDKMLTVFKHLCSAGLLSGLVCQMSRCDRCPRRNRIDADIRVDQTHCHVLRQCIDGPLGGSIGRPAEWPVTIHGRNVDDAAFILRQEDFQGLPDKTDGLSADSDAAI